MLSKSIEMDLTRRRPCSQAGRQEKGFVHRLVVCVCPRQKWDMELIEAKKEQGGGRGIFSGLGRNFPAVASSFLHVFLQRGVRIFV